MKIRLFFAPWEYNAADFDRIYPLGIAYLGAVLEKKGWDVAGKNYGYKPWDSIKDEIKKEIISEKPDIVGLSVLTNNRVSSIRIFNLVKSINPKTINIAGGVHATFFYKQMLENYPSIDFVVLGEAEETIVELTEAINKKAGFKELKKIKGIAFRHNNQIYLTEKRERIKDLNKLPLPKHEYFGEQIKKYKTIFMMSSRGCPFNCEFCPSCPFWGRMVKRRSAENIFSEMKEVLKKFPEVKHIYFTDDEFIVDNQNVIKLCKLIINEKMGITWECAGGRVTSVNEELIKWMKRAGCTSIGFGIESGSQKILDRMNKNQKLPDIIRAVRICKKYGIKTYPLLILGFQGENSRTVSETIKLLKHLKLVGDPGLLFLVPGTGVYEKAKKQGYISDDYWLSNKPMPFYFKENSRYKMAYWNLKVNALSRFYAEGFFGLFKFLRRKFLRNINIHKLRDMIKRYL